MYLFQILTIFSSISSLIDQYTDFLHKYNKTFTDNGLDLYINNSKYVNDINNKNYSYELELNQFADIKYNSTPFKRKKCHNCFTNISNEIPSHINWTKKGVVTNVENQGSCGSCWAFSAIGSVEGYHAIKTNHLYNLSKQELVDCSRNYSNNGCEGGTMDGAFEYIINNGICTEKEYPYVASDNECQKCDPVLYISDYKDVVSNNETSLLYAVSLQPVSVAIEADTSSFQLYKNGIYSDINCGTDLDHGVLIVGYGYDKYYDLQYWIVKNSWGASWGENGYIRILRNSSDDAGICGINMMPSFPY